MSNFTNFVEESPLMLGLPKSGHTGALETNNWLAINYLNDRQKVFRLTDFVVCPTKEYWRHDTPAQSIRLRLVEMESSHRAMVELPPSLRTNSDEMVKRGAITRASPSSKRTGPPLTEVRSSREKKALMAIATTGELLTLTVVPTSVNF